MPGKTGGRFRKTARYAEQRRVTSKTERTAPKASTGGLGGSTQTEREIIRVRIKTIVSTSPPQYNGKLLTGVNSAATVGGLDSGIWIRGINEASATPSHAVEDAVFVLLHPVEPPFIISGSGGVAGTIEVFFGGYYHF